MSDNKQMITTSLRLTYNELQEFKAAAKERGLSLGNLIRTALHEYLGNEPVQPEQDSTPTPSQWFSPNSPKK
jgi:hypothetical protein